MVLFRTVLWPSGEGGGFMGRPVWRDVEASLRDKETTEEVGQRVEQAEENGRIFQGLKGDSTVQ